LFDKGIVDQTIAMIEGTQFYTTALKVLPNKIAAKNAAGQTIGADPAKVPAPVAKKLSYDAKAEVLRFMGGMTTEEQIALKAVSADPDYQAAVDDLFQQPGGFIKDALAGFVNVADAEQELLRKVPTLDEDLDPVL